MPLPKLFHVSEESNIQIFEPRPVPSPDAGVSETAVWAVDENHLANYLLPRDCPRVTYTATDRSSSEDREHFMMETSAARVVATESGWFSRIESCQLFLYELPNESFELIDAGAGYYISRSSVIPKSLTPIKNLVSELLQRNIEVRFLPNLWALRDKVSTSSLEFSIIRFRNALPRLS